MEIKMENRRLIIKDTEDGKKRELLPLGEGGTLAQVLEAATRITVARIQNDDQNRNPADEFRNVFNAVLEKCSVPLPGFGECKD